MHPIERLRYVARSRGEDQAVMVRETAGALRGLGLDPAGIVVACRRIVERHPTAGALWWLCAHVLTSADPLRAARDLADAIDQDPTADHLIELLGGEPLVCLAGWPPVAGEAIARRGDVDALVVDLDGDGSSLVRWLQRIDVAAEIIDPTRTAGAVAHADVLLIEALAADPARVLCPPGTFAAVAAAAALEVPVWAVVPMGRTLPTMFTDSIVERVTPPNRPWDAEVDSVPLRLVSSVVGPAGRIEPAALVAECPSAHELLRISAM